MGARTYPSAAFSATFTKSTQARIRDMGSVGGSKHPTISAPIQIQKLIRANLLLVDLSRLVPGPVLEDENLQTTDPLMINS
jgi:hypothetical protein